MTLTRLREILDHYAKVLDPDETEVYLYCEEYHLIRAVILRSEVDEEEKTELILASK